MDSFDNLIKAACHIKSHQMSFDKKVFDNLPEFYKTGLYYSDMLKNVHNQESFNLKRAAFDVHREKGIHLISNNKYDDAEYSFCKALCIFKHIKSKNPNWKNEGIKDEELEFIEDDGIDSEEKEEIKKLKISALLNIALCNLNLEKFEEARQACDEVIKLDLRNIKAYYRKARSYIDCKSSTLDDYIIALKEIETAKSISPENQEILVIYENLSAMINKQKIQEKKVFKSFFRNVNYKHEEHEIKKGILLDEASKKSEEISKFFTQVTEEDASSGKPEIRILNLLIEQSYVLAERYEREGNRAEMKKMKIIAEKAKTYKEDLQSLLELDFKNPNEELRKFAKKSNLDLNNPKVQEEFKKKRKQYLEEINKFYESNFLKDNIEVKHRNLINAKKGKSVEKKISNTNDNSKNKNSDKSHQIKHNQNNISNNEKSIDSIDPNSEPRRYKNLNLQIFSALILFVGIVFYLIYNLKSNKNISQEI